MFNKQEDIKCMIKTVKKSVLELGKDAGLKTVDEFGLENWN